MKKFSAGRLAGSVATTTALMASLLAFGAGAASADPTDCHTMVKGTTQQGVHAWCTGGTGQYRAVATCRDRNYRNYKMYGHSERIRRTSIALCHDFDRVVGASWQVTEM